MQHLALHPFVPADKPGYDDFCMHVVDGQEDNLPCGWPRRDHFPRPVLSHDGKLTGEATGGTRYCQLAGCTGRQYFVKWPDGRRSWPCSKGLVEGANGTWQIG